MGTWAVHPASEHSTHVHRLALFVDFLPTPATLSVPLGFCPDLGRLVLSLTFPQVVDLVLYSSTERAVPFELFAVIRDSYSRSGFPAESSPLGRQFLQTELAPDATIVFTFTVQPLVEHLTNPHRVESFFTGSDPREARSAERDAPALSARVVGRVKYIISRIPSADRFDLRLRYIFRSLSRELI